MVVIRTQNNLISTKGADMEFLHVDIIYFLIIALNPILVSCINTKMRTLEPMEIHATTWMAIFKSKISGTKPTPIASTTNLESLQNLYTPKYMALHFGCAISLIAASKVGYTSAVPIPSTDIPVIRPTYELGDKADAGSQVHKELTHLFASFEV